MVGFAVCAVMIRSLVKAAIALGATSAVLTVIMFYLGAPMAAVFELSVCAGLITVVFISAISLTKPRTQQEINEKTKLRMKRFVYLPIILIVAAISLIVYLNGKSLDFLKNSTTGSSVQETLWNVRQLDLLALVIVILVGVFGVVVLFKEREHK